MAFAIRTWSQDFCSFPAHILSFCSYLQSHFPLTRCLFSRVLGTGVFQITAGLGQLLRKRLQPWRCFLIDRKDYMLLLSMQPLEEWELGVFFEGKQTCKDFGSDSSPFTQSSVSACQTRIIYWTLWYSAPECKLDQDSSLQQPKLY